MLGEDVDLEVDAIARREVAERGVIAGVRDDRDGEPGRADGVDGQADAGTGDRALLDDVAEQLGRCLEFEDEVEQASETATPHNEINEGNLECRIALFIAGDGSFTNLITWQIEAADEEDPEQMFADLKMKKKKKKVKTEVID